MSNANSAQDAGRPQDRAGARPPPDGDRDSGDRAPRRPGKWPLIILAVAVVAAAIVALWYYLSTRGTESTDDAYTDGRAIVMASKVSGYVIRLNVSDNTWVEANDLLLRIDPRDYIAARDQASAALALAKAQLVNAKVKLEIAKVTYPQRLVQAQAQRASALANRQLALSDFRRQSNVDPRATTRQTIDTAASQEKTASANVAQAQAALDIARLVPQNIAQAESQVRQLEAQVAQAQAQLQAATVNLSYTDIRAPQAGWVTRRNVERGTYLQAGQQIFTIVTPDIWVIANFKETQLDRMRAGQHATVSVDAYPQLHLTGHVDSIQMGTGSRFTAFPAENATGNWVKIVQRVPVKIVIDSGLEPRVPLPLGLSVEATVDVP